MSISCVDCANCGKCYDKISTCARCASEINLLDEACKACGEPVTEAMREAARQAYMQRKREEREAMFPALRASRERRGAWLKKQP